MKGPGWQGWETLKVFGLEASIPQEEAEDRSPRAGAEEQVQQLTLGWAG